MGISHLYCLLLRKSTSTKEPFMSYYIECRAGIHDCRLVFLYFYQKILDLIKWILRLLRHKPSEKCVHFVWFSWLTNVTCWLLESSSTRHLKKIGETYSSVQRIRIGRHFSVPGLDGYHYGYNSFSQGNSLIIHESTNECMHQQLVVITGDGRGEMVADKTLVIHTWLDT